MKEQNTDGNGRARTDTRGTRAGERRDVAVLWLMLIGFLGLVVLAATGCARLGPTPEQTAAMLAAYQTFAAQPRMGEVIRVTGDSVTPAEVTVRGQEVVIATPLPPLTAMERGNEQYDMIKHVATELSRLGMFGLGAYFGAEVLEDRGKTTVIQAAPAQ